MDLFTHNPKAEQLLFNCSASLRAAFEEARTERQAASKNSRLSAQQTEAVALYLKAYKLQDCILPKDCRSDKVLEQGFIPLDLALDWFPGDILEDYLAVRQNFKNACIDFPGTKKFLVFPLPGSPANSGAEPSRTTKFAIYLSGEAVSMIHAQINAPDAKVRAPNDLSFATKEHRSRLLQQELLALPESRVLVALVAENQVYPIARRAANFLETKLASPQKVTVVPHSSPTWIVALDIKTPENLSSMYAAASAVQRSSSRLSICIDSNSEDHRSVGRRLASSIGAKIIALDTVETQAPF